MSTLEEELGGVKKDSIAKIKEEIKKAKANDDKENMLKSNYLLFDTMSWFEFHFLRRWTWQKMKYFPRMEKVTLYSVVKFSSADSIPKD